MTRQECAERIIALMEEAGRVYHEYNTDGKNITCQWYSDGYINISDISVDPDTKEIINWTLDSSKYADGNTTHWDVVDGILQPPTEGSMCTYRYICTQRPPGPGAVPSGAVNVEYFEFPTEDHGGHAVRAYGAVEYDHKLTDREIDDYELMFDGEG